MLKRRRDDERGVALPIVALMMVLLLIMVAFAVDLGAASVERRNAQNAADSAALAAAQQLGITAAKFKAGPARTAALNAAMDEAKEYVSANTGLPVDSPDWAACTDAFALAVPSSETACISFAADATQVRVTLPGKRMEYQFARMAGVNSTTVHGAAVAAVASTFEGSTRPLLLRTSRYGYNCVEGGGGQICPSNPPPLGPGDFGSLTSPRYKVVIGGGDATNFALGVDHMLKLTPTNGRNYCDSNNAGDGNKCNNQAAGGLLNDGDAAHDLANYLITDSGGELGDVGDGLIGSIQPELLCPLGAQCFEDEGETITALLYRPDGAEANVLRPPGLPGGPLMSGFGRVGFNGVHISRYFVSQAVKNTVGCATAPDNQNIPLSDSGYNTCNSNLSTYITSNAGSTTPTPIFSKNIITSPRFGVAPVTDTALSGVSTVAKIIDFYGLYIDRLYGTPTQVKGMHAFVFPLSFIEPISGAGGGSLPYLGGPFSVHLIQ